MAIEKTIKLEADVKDALKKIDELTDSVDDFALNSANTLGTSIINNSDASGTAGDAGGLYIADNTNCFIYLSAEL